MADAPLLELRGITKQFPGVVANDHVDFELAKGEVHALLGENGAGKSTLMNILYGLYHPDEGEIRLNGKPLASTRRATRSTSGIGMVHQHFMLIPVMTVAENIVLANEPTNGPFLDLAAERTASASSRRSSASRYAPRPASSRSASACSSGSEILKALYRGAEILILDEPTAVLTPQEASELFAIIRSLQAEGQSIIFISHKLNEVLEIADRITVLRQGKQSTPCRAPGRRRRGSPSSWSAARSSSASRSRQASPESRCSTVEDSTCSTIAARGGARRLVRGESRGDRRASRASTATARPSSSTP